MVTFVVGGAAGTYAASAAGLFALWGPASCCALLGGWYALYRHRQHVAPHIATNTLPHPVA